MGTEEHDLEASHDSPEAAVELDVVSALPAEAPSPEAQKKAIYTMVAHQGLNAAEMLNAALKTKTIGTDPPRRVEVTAPDGPSTDGGKRARQAIRLVPTEGRGGTVLCGALDVAQKTLELRTYRNACAQHQERYGKRFDVSPEDYANLLKQLGAMVHALQFKVTVTPDTSSPSVPAPAPGTAQPATSPRAAPSDAPAEAPGPKRPFKPHPLLWLAAAIAVGVLVGFLLPAG